MAQVALRLQVCLFAALLVYSDATAPAPGPARPLPCFRTRTKYNPLDMTGQPRTDTERAEDCQARCAKTSGCTHFTWYENRGCHVADSKANRVRAKTSAMSGPVDCETGNFCFRNGFKYEPGDMNGHPRTDTINAEDCQLRCDNTDGCTSFFWYPDGGCHIQDAAAKIIEADENIVSGPPNCDPTSTTTTVTTKTSTSTITATKTKTTTSATITKTTSTETTSTKTTTSVTTTSKTTSSSTETTITKTTTTKTTITETTTTKTTTSSTKTTTTKTGTTTTKTATTTTTKTATSTTITQTSTSITTTTTTTTTQTSTSSLTTSSSAPDVCLMAGAKFTMPDGGMNMPGQERSQTKSPYTCQSKCRKTKGCAHFSWWSDSGCHLQDESAAQAKASADAVAGPTSCQYYGYCFENRHEWEPLSMPKSDRSSEPNPGKCQERCQETAGCKHFTFWSDGGCHLQDANAIRKDADNSVTSGPRYCHHGWTCEDGYLPAHNNIDVMHLTPNQARMRCINQGCKGFSYKGSAEEQGRVKVFIKSQESGGIDPDSKGQGWLTCMPEGHLTDEEFEKTLAEEDDEQDAPKGGEDSDEGGNGTKEDSKSEKEDDGKGSNTTSDQKENSEDSKGDSKSEKEDNGKGNSTTDGKGSNTTSDQEEKSEYSSSKDRKELQRLFAADDKPETVEFTTVSWTDSLSGIAAGSAGILMAAGALVMFRSRRPVAPELFPVLLVEEAPDQAFAE